jgi:hypothetical protein
MPLFGEVKLNHKKKELHEQLDRQLAFARLLVNSQVGLKDQLITIVVVKNREKQEIYDFLAIRENLTPFIRLSEKYNACIKFYYSPSYFEHFYYN